MIVEIQNILANEVDVYGFVSIEEYLKKSALANKEVRFLRTPDINEFQTIITLGLSYPSIETPYKGTGYGLLSRYSYQLDYHIVFRSILDRIEKQLNNIGIRTFSSVDISDIDERFASYLAKIGFLGKNQFLINKRYGSYLYLATILIDLKIDTIPTVLDDCGTCRKCINACPTNALDNGFDESRCLSSITQSKREFSLEEISHLTTMIYGCDICQKVCPKNKGIDFHLHKEFEPSGIENINLIKLLEMSNREYLDVYGNNASSWRGSLVIKRNALCLIANQLLVEAIPQINQSMIKYHDVLWYNKTAQKVLNILEGK